jgi:hypothetical protein
MAWVAAEATRGVWRPAEKPVLLAAYLLPLFARGVALRTGLVLTPLVVAAMFAIIVRRGLTPAPMPAC